MEKKDKIIIIVLIVIIVLCLTAGVGGLVYSKSNAKNKANSKKDNEYQIKKIYYVDDEEVDTKPVNPEGEILYIHNDEKLTCSNNVVAIWDNDEWDIKIPKPNTDTTCKIYFTSTTAEVEFNITNGSLENTVSEEVPIIEEIDNIVVAKKNEDLVQKIKPMEGYKFASVKCTNDEQTSWNETTNELTIKNIQTDTMCEVIFSINTYELDLAVSNGTGAIKKTYDYESPITINVTPNNGFATPTVSCTNDQTASWENNTFKIEKLTNNTSCIVEFKKLKYSVKIVVGGGTISEPTKEVEYGSNASFTIKPMSGYSVNPSSNNCPNYATKKEDGNLIITLNNITSNITCDITLEAAPIVPSQE